MNNYPAIKVMYAIFFTYLKIGNEEYAKMKTNSFLKRCEVDINKPKEQPIDKAKIEQVCYAMLDNEREFDFWKKLNILCEDEGR